MIVQGQDLPQYIQELRAQPIMAGRLATDSKIWDMHHIIEKIIANNILWNSMIMKLLKKKYI